MAGQHRRAFVARLESDPPDEYLPTVANSRTLQQPTAMGWYVVWRKANGAEQPPQLYFCVEANAGDVSCMSARPSENEEFLPVCHASFNGAFWLGPFKTRKEATLALEQAAG